MLGLTRQRIVHKIIAIAMCFSVVGALAACGQQATPSASPTQSATDHNEVALFVPDDGFTIAQDIPLNTWHNVVQTTTDALVQRGMDSHQITTHSDHDLVKQSHRIQDYVVDQIDTNDSNHDPASTTLVIAPAVTSAPTAKYYSDLITQQIDMKSSATQDNDEQASTTIARLVNALQLARNHGMHVVVLATPIPNFTPDAFVSMTTARQIGKMQAQQLVSKLRLDTASKTNPKQIEVLLPFISSDKETTTDDYLAQEAFAGIWEVLGSYVRDGVAVSPSHTLSASTQASDWKQVTIDASDADHVREALRQRLSSKQDTLTRIDGIIAMNDHVAATVTSTLTDLGYVGSSADVNPSITIGDIVGNIAGRKDLSRSRVPDPQQAPTTSSRESSTDANNRWPIVTGYGAYKSNIPNIVDGKQWMTGLVNRDDTAHNLAQLCVALNESHDMKLLPFLDHASTLYGEQVPTMSLSLVAVSAGNLKPTLIDPGYITLAEAGL